MIAKTGFARQLGNIGSKVLRDETPAGTAAQVPIDDIVPDPNNPRKSFDQAALDELAQSIEARGILQPIVLSPKNDAERRIRAAAATIPATPRYHHRAVRGSARRDRAATRSAVQGGHRRTPSGHEVTRGWRRPLPLVDRPCLYPCPCRGLSVHPARCLSLCRSLHVQTFPTGCPSRPRGGRKQRRPGPEQGEGPQCPSPVAAWRLPKGWHRPPRYRLGSHLHRSSRPT
ncbi:MAG: hypothetical protein EOP66_15880 [Sphingomonas sp.]|nr:MAG: hypothetical protein EOP66_15880 [Sphingomonas sp.]